ncbi:MAG: DNA-processing protein DprA [Saprospiraceae bacterium]|nr:DNA-processing protein DprA [Saprospiraceae bacterium]
MEYHSQDLLLKIALTHLPNVGAILARNLVGFAGGVEAVFKQRKSELLKIPGIGDKTADEIVRKKSFDKAERELKFIERHDITPLFYLDNDYPFRLKRIKDAPLLLYFKGNCDLNTARVVAIVGTRKPTVYGINQCEKFVDHVRNMGVTIISGLAYGIDIVAHRKALEVGLPTIGAMGSGMDRIYPATHKKAALDMLSNGGLITEFGHGTKPDRENFPMRNRIIAGMCDALLVIESDVKGGSMITAEMANNYHKDVFAVPGRVGDQWSRGCNFLIKTNRAALVDEPDDLVSAMHWKELEGSRDVQRSIFVDLTDVQQRIFDMLDYSDPVSVDRLYKESNLSSSELASILLNLEFMGLIKALPGKVFLKV